MELEEISLGECEAENVRVSKIVERKNASNAVNENCKLDPRVPNSTFGSSDESCRTLLTNRAAIRFCHRVQAEQDFTSALILLTIIVVVSVNL